MTTTYQVWQATWAATEPRLQKLAKRAAKLGIAITWTLDAWTPAIVGYERDIDGQRAYPAVPIYANRATATLTGEIPKLPGGWMLVGCIELLEGNVLLRNVPGETMPVQYRDAARATLCQHCNAKRDRKETFVVRDEAGAHKQVGRQCIADFLGHVDPHAVIAGAELLLNLEACMSSAGDWDEDGGGSRERRLWPVDRVVAQSAAIVRVDGWFSRKNAEIYQKRATADSVGDMLMPPKYRTSELVRWMDAREATDADRAEAEAATEWGKALDGANDYEYNLSVVCRAEFIEARHVGILASLISAYQRHMGQQRERAAETSTFQGEVGKREVFTLTVEHTQDFESDFGLRVMNRMRDGQGNLFVWWSSGVRLEVGATYTGKATVKAHDEYKGRKQTTVSRFAGQTAEEIEVAAQFKADKKAAAKAVATC